MNRNRGLRIGFILIFLFLNLIIVSSNECNCVFIKNETKNSSQVEFMISTLLNKVNELEKPISNESCRFIINQLNSNIEQKNQIITGQAEKINKYKNYLFFATFTFLGIIILLLNYKRIFESLKIFLD